MKESTNTSKTITANIKSQNTIKDMKGEITMKDILNRVVNTLEKVEVSGRDNMWNMFVCMNQLKKASEGDESIDIQKAIDVLNQIPVSGLENIACLCGSIDALTKLVEEDKEDA